MYIYISFLVFQVEADQQDFLTNKLFIRLMLQMNIWFVSKPKADLYMHEINWRGCLGPFLRNKAAGVYS
jgi:hypothetical protein